MNEWMKNKSYTLCWINAVFFLRFLYFSCLDLINIPQVSKWVCFLCQKLTLQIKRHVLKKTKDQFGSDLPEELGLDGLRFGTEGWVEGLAMVTYDLTLELAAFTRRSLLSKALVAALYHEEKKSKKYPLNNHVHQISCVLAPQTSRSIKDIV